jgi:cytochrome c peroxidase
MKKITLLSAILLVLLAGLSSCFEKVEFAGELSTPVLPEKVLDYDGIGASLPDHLKVEFVRAQGNVFGLSVNRPDGSVFIPRDRFGPNTIGPNGNVINSASPGRLINPLITDDGATLGRVLFYDTRLSINNSISCASCHHQSAAFADPVQFSKGFGGKITPRNSMAIVNSALNSNLFWDSRAKSVSHLALQPVQNHIEMGMESMEVLEKKLAATSFYPGLFAKAYKTQDIKAEKIAEALAQFVCSIASKDSKFDQGMSTKFANFNALEKMGMEIFNGEKAKCGSCHSGANFAAADDPMMGGEYSAPEVAGTAVIGLELQAKDKGKDNGSFRIPSLRNIALTGPYMHDGRFKTLDEVIEHYNSGIQNHPQLDKKLRSGNGGPLRMNLNALEKKALVAFLHTLSDEKMTVDERFSNPFLD